jgi:hypothetical protein
MSISSVNRNSHGDCPVRESGDGKFFPVRMGRKEKVPRKRFEDEDEIFSPSREDSVLENFIKIIFMNVYLSYKLFLIIFSHNIYIYTFVYI